MELPDVVDKLVEIHQHDQRESGQDDADKVTPSCCPLTDLKGFDSLLIPLNYPPACPRTRLPAAKGNSCKEHLLCARWEEEVDYQGDCPTLRGNLRLRRQAKYEPRDYKEADHR